MSSNAQQGKGAALVTGAAGIIGPSICAILKREGWKVVAAGSSLDSFKRYEHYHGKPVEADTYLAVDLSSVEDCRRLVREAEAAQGPIGLLVNNASANKSPISIENLDPKLCETLVRVDLLAPLYLANAALASLEKTRGSIINISSVSAEENDIGNLLYGALKLGLEKATKNMANELLSKGIRVNAIRVGSVPGDAFLRPLISHLPEDTIPKVRQEAMEAHYASWREATIDGRTGRPEDIGEMIAYLASDKGDFINAAVLTLDGAYAMQRRQREALGGTFSSKVLKDWKSDPEKEINKILKK